MHTTTVYRTYKRLTERQMKKQVIIFALKMAVIAVVSLGIVFIFDL